MSITKTPSGSFVVLLLTTGHLGRSVLMLSLCSVATYINKATPRPDGRKAIVRLTTRMIASRVIADSSKTFLGVGKAIGWLAQGNLNREVGNPFRSKTNRAQGKFWPTEAQTGEPCPLATRFLHGIVARSAQTMSPTLRPTARSLGPPQVSHVQAQRPSTKREDV
jgi:hypothetical protein